MPMLLPEEQEVTLYGAQARQGDSEVLGPADLA